MHTVLTGVLKELAWAEIAASKKKIEEELRELVRAFYYLYGSFGEEIRKLVQEERVNCAVVVCGGTNNQKSDLHELRRID